jgi:O-antigen ligase
LAIVLTISSSIYIIVNNNNISKRFLHVDDIARTNYFEKIKTHEPRFLIWKYCYEIFKESNILFGNGFEETEKLLLNKYQSISPKKKRDWFIQKRFNTHNQYLDILLSQGYIGLVIFIIFLFYLFKKSFFSHKFIMLFTTLSLYMFIYNNFHRVLGVFIFSFILISILNNTHKK